MDIVSWSFKEVVHDRADFSVGLYLKSWVTTAHMGKSTIHSINRLVGPQTSTMEMLSTSPVSLKQILSSIWALGELLIALE